MQASIESAASQATLLSRAVQSGGGGRRCAHATATLSARAASARSLALRGWVLQCLPAVDGGDLAGGDVKNAVEQDEFGAVA